MSIEMIMIVMITSFVLSILLNKISEKKGLKKKAEKMLDEKPYLSSVPWIIGAIALFVIIFGSRIGLNLPIIIGIQVVAITVAMFLFDLFR